MLDREELGELVELGRGGQGVVYRAPEVSIPFVGAAVYKEYLPTVLSALNPAGLMNAVGLFARLSRPEAEAFLSLMAWPVGLVQVSRRVVGMLMPEVPQRFFAVISRPSGATPTQLAKIEYLLNSDDYLSRTGLPLSNQTRYGLLREVAGGLALLHRYGIVVGDLSPRNLLFSIDEPPACHFIDCDSMSVKGVRALPEFESPDWSVREVSTEPLGTTASDSYKFGLLGLRLLTGKQRTRDPNQLDSSVPDGVRRLIEQALDAVPSKRPILEAWQSPLAAAAGERPHFVVGQAGGISTESVRSRLGGPFRAKAPFMFAGRAHMAPRSLAEHMAKEWTQACDLIAGKDLKELAYWLGQYQPSPELLQALNACQTQVDGFPIDRLAAMVILEMAPDLPITFRGFAIDPRSIVDLAEVAATSAGPHRDVVQSLRRSRALIVYSSMPGCANYAQLDDQWQRSVSAIFGWAKTCSELRDLLDNNREAEMEADLLWALTSAFSRKRLESAANAATTDAASEQAWFLRFRQNQPDVKPQSLLPAFYWAVVALAPIAEEHTAAQVEEQRREAEKQREAAARREAAAFAERQREAAEEKRREQEAKNEREALERLASQILAEPDGPVGRYLVALEIERSITDDFARAREWRPGQGAKSLQAEVLLPPLPAEGSSLDQLDQLADLIPVAGEWLRDLGRRVPSMSASIRTEAERRLAMLEAAAPPPHRAMPPPPRPPVARLSSDPTMFLLMSVGTVAAVVAAPLSCKYGSSHYSGGANNGADLLRIVLAIGVWVIAGFAVVGWMGMLSSVRNNSNADLRTEYESARKDYEEQMKAYKHQQIRRDEFAGERRIALAQMEESRIHADFLDGIGRRSRIAAADLLDDTMSTRIREAKHRIRE